MTSKVFQSFWLYISTPIGKSSDEFAEEIKEEIAFHIDQRASDLERQGLERGEADALAMAKFGDVSKIATACHLEAASKLNWMHRAHLILTAGLSLAVLILFIVHFHGSLRSLAGLPPGIHQMLDNDWTGSVHGNVLNDDGLPIVGAQLMISVKTWPDGSFFQRAFLAVTDREGRFLLEKVRPCDEHSEVQVTAVAPHREMRSSYKVFEAGETGSIDFQLAESTTLTLQLLDETGNPIPGIPVLPHERIDRSGCHHLVYVDSGKLIVGTTDLEGRIELPYFQAGDAFTVLVQAKGEWLPFEASVPQEGNVASIRAANSF